MKALYRLFFCLSFVLLTFTGAYSQLHVGVEAQAYPTGFIPGLRVAFPVGIISRGEVNIRLGYQIIDHQDFGVQDDETGTGFGGTLGYRHYLKGGRRGFFGGVRADLWFNKIDWISNALTPAERRGQSNVTVLQPTAEVGYLFMLGESNISIAPALGFGVEWNIATEGLPTGEGPIVLGGISIMYQLP